MAAVVTPLACGGATVPPPSDVKLPDGVARQVRTCAAQHLEHFGRGELSVHFDIKLADDGHVDSVTLRESTLGDEDAEACMAHALRSLSLGDLPMRLSDNVSPEPLAPGSRGLVGSPTLAGLAPVSLAPVLITGIGIIIVVAVVVYMSTDTEGDEEARRCKKVKEECIDTCTETSLPTPDFGVKFRRCMRACMEAKGCVF